ncbi:YydG family radical SAM peptide epimerase, partial [Enterococcus faecalis]
FDAELILNHELYEDFDKTITKMNSNLLLYIMRREGFTWFINIVSNNNEFSHIKINKEFSSISSICRQLFKTENNIKLLT